MTTQLRFKSEHINLREILFLNPVINDAAQRLRQAQAKNHFWLLAGGTADK